jgi:hypothetical protein
MVDHKENVDDVVLLDAVESANFIIITRKHVSVYINPYIQNSLLEWHLESTVEALLLN